jgi:hypothetical protein
MIIGEIRNEHNILVGYPEEKNPMEDLSLR